MEKLSPTLMDRVRFMSDLTPKNDDVAVAASILRKAATEADKRDPVDVFTVIAGHLRKLPEAKREAVVVALEALYA